MTTYLQVGFYPYFKSLTAYIYFISHLRNKEFMNPYTIYEMHLIAEFRDLIMPVLKRDVSGYYKPRLGCVCINTSHYSMPKLTKTYFSRQKLYLSTRPIYLGDLITYITLKRVVWFSVTENHFFKNFY